MKTLTLTDEQFDLMRAMATDGGRAKCELALSNMRCRVGAEAAAS